MKKGADIAAKFDGLYLIHHNLPGKNRKDMRFSEHLLFFPLQGEIRLQVGEKEYSCCQGRMLYLPPQIRHNFLSSQHLGERMIALLSPEIWGKINFPLSLLPANPLVKEILFYLLLHPKARHQNSLISVLIETLSELLEITAPHGGIDHLESQIRDFRVKAAFEYMKAHFDQDISMEMVAKASGLALRSLNRLVLAEMGMSPRNILIHIRVRQAQEWLRLENKKIAEIALDVGYQSLGQFIDVFRKITGSLPSEWQKSAHNGQFP